MRIRLVKGSRIPVLVRVQAITLYPFILFRHADPAPELVTHERIHAAQVRRDGWVYFYARYLWHYAKGRLRIDNTAPQRCCPPGVQVHAVIWRNTG